MTLVDIGANLTHSSFREAQAFERRIEVLDPDLDFAHARPAQGGERSRREGEPDEDEGNREREGGGRAGGQPPGEIRVGDGEDRRQRQHERVEKPLHPQACVGATASVAQLTQVNTRDAAGVTMPGSAR
jgi:hypothetical protein